MREFKKSRTMVIFLAIIESILLALPISSIMVAEDSESTPPILPPGYGNEQNMGPYEGELSDDLRLANVSSQSEKPRIAVNGNNIHVVFEDARDGNIEIYYKKSTDNGSTWTDDIRLTNNAEISNHPSIAVNGNCIHIVWTNWDWKNYAGDSSMEVFYKRSEDNGLTWTLDIQLTDVFDSVANWANIAVNGSNVHVVWDDWRDGFYREIYYKRSTDNGYTWSDDIRLTNDLGDSADPEIAVNGSNVHIIWSDNRLGSYEVFYKRSTDNGLTWSIDTAISNLDAKGTYVDSIKAYGNSLHVVMTDDRFTVFPDMNYEIYYRRSTDNGDTWGSEVRLTNAPGDQDSADVSLNQTNIYVMWQDNRTGTRQIYFKKSKDDGVTWETEIPITSSEKNSLWPRLATNKNQIHAVWFDGAGYLYGAVWQDDRIYYTKSIDDGLTWQDNEVLTNTSSLSYLPALAVAEDSIHVLWYNFNGSSMGPDVFYKHSGDSGFTWDEDLNLVDDPAFPMKYPAVGASSSNVHVVWVSEKDGYGTEIYYKNSSDNGTTWSIDVRLTNHMGSSLYPSIAVSGNEIHVVWIDDRDGNFEIYYKNSMDNGVNWIPDVRLTNWLNESFYPSIAVDGNNVHVVWQDLRDGNWEIYYKKSINKGASWGADTRLTNAVGDSLSPKIAANYTNIHVTWYDGRNGNYEIYYKNSTNSGITWNLDSRLTDNPNDSCAPTIGVNGSNIHIMWQDLRDGNWEIYYKNSRNNGAAWSADTGFTNAVNSSCCPVIAASNDNLHVIWVDDRTGLRGIYYNRSLAFPPDAVPPIISDAKANPSPQEVGEIVNISATITDDIAVSAAYVEVRDPNNCIIGNFTMLKSGDTYYNETPYGPPLGTYTFTIWARDTNDDWATAIGTFIIQDTTPPALVDIATLPDPQEVFKAVNISANIIDNYQIFGVWVEFFDPHGNLVGNFSMQYDLVNERYYWNQSYDIIGTYTFTIWVNDTSDNWASVSSSCVIQDTTPPMITEVLAVPDPQEVFAAVNISVKITDNYQPFGVWVEIYDIEGNFLGNFSMLYDSVNGLNYWDQTYDAMGIYTFIIWANDTSDNWASTSGSFTIQDTTPPTITDVAAVPDPQEVFGAVNISTNVTDNYQPFGAWIEVYDPEGNFVGNFSMLYDRINDRYYWNQTYDVLGAYTFTIWANDTSDNWESASDIFDIRDLTKPKSEVDDLPTYTIAATFIMTATVSDVSGVQKVELWYKWNTGDWTLFGTDTVAPWSWSFDSSTSGGDGTYQFYSRAYDTPSNYEDAPIGNDTWTIVDTQEPVIIETIPADGAKYVKLTSNITIIFSETMDTKSVEDAFGFSDGEISWCIIDGEVTWASTYHHNDTLVFDPYEDLNTGMNNTVTIGNTAKDLAGNTLSTGEKPNPWSFTTPFPTPPPKKENWKPFIALIFAIILLIAGSVVAKNKPLVSKIKKLSNEMFTFFTVVLPFFIAEIISGIISWFTGALRVPSWLGIGMFVDLAILTVGLLVYFIVYKKGISRK